MNKAVISIGILITLALVGVCVDCSCGVTRYHECHVLDHHYVASYTTTTVGSDSDGHTTIDTIHHPEEFHVICQRYGDDALFDCSESMAKYYAVTNGQQVTVSTRQGRWTHAQYLPSVR